MIGTVAHDGGGKVPRRQQRQAYNREMIVARPETGKETDAHLPFAGICTASPLRRIAAAMIPSHSCRFGA